MPQDNPESTNLTGDIGNNNNNNNKGEQQLPLSGQDIAKNNQDHDNIQEILQSDSIFKTPEQVETHDILSTLTSNCYNEQGQELNLQGHQQINIHPDFYYNKHNESIFDDERIFPCLPTTNDNEDLVKYDEFNPELINHATIKALIIQMTSPEVIDYSLICDFFLTYRMFSNSNEIMNLLLTRLIWALQYLNSVSEDNIKIGKLVLVRTFVVLRHWIINYFVDDFNNNNELCDYFTNTINKITLESNLIPQQQQQQQLESTNKDDSNHSLFTRKILGDLKIHWLKIINEFWLLDLDIHSMLTNNSAYDYILPLTSTLNNIKKLSKSNTEASIRSNPSYRRSAMLSLYDQRIQHKMLIFDDTSSNNQQENPQFSINNLLLHHHSSRVSINNKIKTIQQQKKLLKSPTFSSSFNIPKSPLISNSNLANIPSPTPAPTHTPTTPTRLHLRSNNKRALMQSKRHNHMNIKDSSLDLKKTTTTILRNFDRTDIVEQEGDTDFDEEKENEETEEVDFDQVHDIDNDKSPESQFSESESKRYSQVGFSTNGNIKLPTSKVTVIVPPTPVKKMEKPPLIEDDIQPSSMTPPKLYHPQFQPPPSSSNSIRTENEDLNRRGSIRKLMDNWKKSLIVHKVSSSATDMPINRTMSTKPSTEDLDRLINNAMSVMNEKTVIGKRVDVLSARIIDELEYLIRYYISSESSSVIHEMNYHDDTGDDMEMEVINDNDNDLEEEEDDDRPHRRTRQDKGDVDLHPIEVSPTRAEEIEMDINDLSDLNIVKIDNLINDTTADNSHSVKVPRNISTSYFLDEIDIGNDNNNDNDNDNVKESSSTSFQSPISINWNDEDNINLDGSIEKTPLEEEFEGFEFLQEITTTTNNNNNSTSNDKKQTQPDYSEPNFSFQHSQSQSYSQFQSHSHSHSKSHETSSISTPSNITQYDAEIEELGIAMSPQLIKPKRISFCESTNINSAGFNKRLSVWSKNSITNSISNSNSNGSIAFKRDSMKSYVSYDSAFSVFNESNGNSNGNSFKIENTTTEYNGLKKKTAFNNLRSIVNNLGDGINLENAIRVVSSNQNHLSLSLSRHSSKGSGSGSRKSVRFSTLCALTELPFHEHIAIHNETIISTNANVATNNNNCNHSKLSSSGDAANSSIFSLAMKSRKSSIRTVNKESSTQSTAFTNSSNNSVAIPGISSYALKELAAIPDETMLSTEDPIQYALHKLEGKSSSKLTLKRKDDDDNDNDDDDDDEYLKQPHIDDDTQDILNEINNANTEDAIGLSNTSIEISQVDPPLTPIRMSCRNSNSDMTESDPITSTPRNSQYHENQQQQNHNHNGGDNNVIDTFDFQQPSKPNESTTPSSLEYQSPKIILDNYSPSSDLLSVLNVLFNDAHISFVLSYDSRSLADHFTMIEKDMLQEIDWKDLIELKWNKELTPVNSWLEIIVNDDYYIENKGVNLVIARFNLMVNWIISEILLTQSPNERIHLISRFIHIAQHCLELQNFATLMQIILALTSQRIQKLKQTWKDLIPGDILLLKNLEELASPLKNFLNIRLTINQIKPSKGCIPFVGLYLSDLTFNAERASIIKEHNHNLSGDGDGDGEGEGDTLINFAKFRTSVHIVKSLSQCIEWSSNYKFDIQPDLLSKCLYIKSLDEDEMKYCIQHNQK